MSHTPTNQKGFAALEALLIAIILAIIGGTGYYVYQANNKSTDTQNAAQVAANSAVKHKKGAAKKPAAAQQYLTIKEWGVRGKLDSSVTPEYAITSDANQTWARLSSDQLIAADPQCSVANSAGGIINRAKADDHAYNQAGDDLGITIKQEIDNGTLKNYKKVGVYYYWLDPGQAACGAAAAATQAIQDKTIAAFKSAVSNFEAIP
jgi:Tfp pilus assembly protein PilV